MSGELQTIPARHGVATFVPRGRTIKVINTYGQQVVSMWAFALGAPPEEGEMDEKGPAQQMAEAQEQKGGNEPTKKVKEAGSEEKVRITAEEKKVIKGETSKEDVSKEETSKEDVSKERKSKEEAKDESPQTETSEPTPTNPRSKRTWSSYLPSIPYRSKGKSNGSATEPKIDTEAEKAQNEAKTKRWSSYLPTGQGFSSYVPNVDSSTIVSAFKSSHYRDPNKSYAEQLYDFSKTPVGAGTLAGMSIHMTYIYLHHIPPGYNDANVPQLTTHTAATGSSYASSVYAAYNAYSQMHPSKSSLAPMEYLSLPHTRASSYKLVPSVDDTLLTNLRNPIITLIEDTTPGAHDTLTAACDANLYAKLGVDAPAEHGSCAENLVLALKEMNEKSGLKGTKAVGADISVNIAPTPLHLFMNAPLQLSESAQTEEGTGAKGVTLSVAAPTAKKRSFVRFRAERDVVVVFSACPMDVGPQNGGRCMAANFMVEEAEGEDLAASNPSVKGKKDGSVSERKDDKSKNKNKTATTKFEASQAPEKKTDAKEETKSTELKPRKKPKKLEIRSQGTSSTPAKSSS